MKKTIEVWASRDSDGDLRVFVEEPVANEYYGEHDYGSVSRWRAENPLEGDSGTWLNHGTSRFARALIEALEPLTHEGGQVARVRLTVEDLERWEADGDNCS